MSTFAAFFTMGTVCLLVILGGCGVGALIVTLHQRIFGERKDGL